MTKRIMSDAEMRRRQKLQGQIGRTTSTLGLAGLGVTGVAALGARNKGALRAVRKIPGLTKTTPDKLKNIAINTGLVSGGIGGVGGFNQASIYSTEARRRKQRVVVVNPKQTASKRLEEDDMYYAEEGHPVVLPTIEVPIEKAWSPSASNFDSESNRKRRSTAYEGGALVGAGAGAAYAVGQGKKVGQTLRAIKPVDAVKVTRKRPASGEKKQKVSYLGRHGKNARKMIPVTSLKPALKHGGKAGLGAAVAGGGIGTAVAIHRRKDKGSWEPYAKRNTISAFGVDHHEWTTP